MTGAERIDPATAPRAAPLVAPAEAEPPRRAAPASNAELLHDLNVLAADVATLDVASCDPSSADLPATLHRIHSALERGARLLLALDRLHQPLAAPLELVELRQTPSAPPRVEDMCFVGALELNRALRALSLAPDQAERLVAAETACRKLRRALRAVITAASADGSGAGPKSEQQRRHESTDLLSALAARKLYARFRRSLRRPSDDSSAAVLAALRYAAGALAILVGSPDYAKARLSDRALLRRLRERLLAWARGDQSGREGLQLLGDVWTCADLLRGVNRRQELRAHDALRLRSLVRGPGDDRNAWLRSCEALSGLDDELDTLLESTSPAGTAEDRVTAILARLNELE